MPFSFDYRLSNLSASTALQAPLAALIGVLLGAAIASKPLAVVGLIGLGLAAVGVVVALRRPALAFGGLICLMALVPTYAAPSIGPLLFLPVAAASCVIALTLAWSNFVGKGYAFHMTVVDYAALIFAIAMGISLFFSVRTANTDYVRYFFLWGGPYLAARLLLANTKRPVRVLALSFGIALLLVAPIAIAESLGASNPFYNLNFNSTEFSIWAAQVNRFGQIRAVASFGHPIAFSMFAAATGLLAIAMGINSRSGKQRYAWYLLAILAVGVQALALSRTGWLMLAVGIVAMALVSVRGTMRRRLTIVLAITVAVVLVTAVVLPHELQVLPGGSDAGEQGFRNSGLYREALLNRALEPGVLHLWGNPVNKITPAVNFGSATDNAYIILADTWGLIPTFALFGVAVALLIAAGRAGGRGDEPLSTVPIVAFTCMVAIFFVAFITQQQVMIWVLFGAAGAAAERASAKRREVSGAAAPWADGGSRSTDPGSPA